MSWAPRDETELPWWWTADTEQEDNWLSEFGGDDIRALVIERNRLLAIEAAARKVMAEWDELGPTGTGDTVTAHAALRASLRKPVTP